MNMIDKLHRPFFFTLVGLVCVGAALVIAKIWGIELPDDMFVKIIATLGVLILLFGFFLVVNSDFGQHKKLKDDNYLD